MSTATSPSASDGHFTLIFNVTVVRGAQEDSSQSTFTPTGPTSHDDSGEVSSMVSMSDVESSDSWSVRSANGRVDDLGEEKTVVDHQLAGRMALVFGVLCGQALRAAHFAWQRARLLGNVARLVAFRIAAATGAFPVAAFLVLYVAIRLGGLGLIMSLLPFCQQK